MRSLWISVLLFFSIGHCDICPPGYNQAPNGGDCFKCKGFFDDFAGQNIPKSFDEAEAGCNYDGGGLLTSIHSEEEWNGLRQVMNCQSQKCQSWLNIGLKCKGKDCKWDDGSPVDYTNFRRKKGPRDDEVFACYGWDQSQPYGQWQERGSHHGDANSCLRKDKDCWICRVKARTIDCVDGETEYKGGCVSVQTTPLDQKSAEESCPGGGHLVSIHSINENEFYQKLALDAGVSGTFYIGGQFSNGVFEWTDGTNRNMDKWASSFPNTFFGSCVQMLLDSSFGVAGQWTNIDCTVKQAYMCFRDGAVYDPTAGPPRPKADAHCPSTQYFTDSGHIYSPNYPLSIPSQQSCSYLVGTSEGTRASIKFPSYDCQSETYLELYDGMNSNQPFITFTTTGPAPDQSFTASSSVIKMIFTTNGTAAPVGTGWEAEFTGVKT